jgi:hypothetical protein
MVSGRTIFSWHPAKGAVALILLFYWWTISGGTLRGVHLPDRRNHYFGQLAEGFSQGHTWYPMTVPQWVLNLPNPYDPGTNGSFRGEGAHDLTLFNGRLYSYWGPVPALMLWLLAVITRVPPHIFDDAHLVLLFVTGLLMVSTVFILKLRDRFFPDQPIWAAILCIFVTGLAAPNLAMLARPAVYEVAIAGTEFFLILGLLLAFIGIDGEPRLAWLAAAAVCWSLALGCGINMAPAIAVVALLTLWYCRSDRISAAVCLGLPLVATVASLLYYNHVRFGSFTEFGTRYQLAGIDQTRAPLYPLFRWHYVPFNVLRYLVSPPLLESHFPFIIGWLPGPGLRRQFHLPEAYLMEENLIGVVWSVPFLWYSIWAARVAPGTGRWLAGSLALSGLAGIFPALMLPASTERFLNHATCSFCLLAALGFFGALSGQRPRQTRIIGCCLAAISITMGMLISIRVYNYHWETTNPPVRVDYPNGDIILGRRFGDPKKSLCQRDGYRSWAGWEAGAEAGNYGGANAAPFFVRHHRIERDWAGEPGGERGGQSEGGVARAEPGATF